MSPQTTPHPFPTASYDPANPVTFTSGNSDGKDTTEGEGDGSVFLGNPSNYWRFIPSTRTFDLTRNALSNEAFDVQTTTYPIKLAKGKTALIIVDMQNFFLHPEVRDHPSGLKAGEVLLEHVLPACHEKGIQVIYLNWGLNTEDLQSMPPALIRSFMKSKFPPPPPSPLNTAYTASLAPPTSTIDPTAPLTATQPVYVGLGQPMPQTLTSTSPDSPSPPPGSVLMRSSWNASLYPPLQASFESSQSSSKPDLVFHKNRLSGLWGRKKDGGLEDWLEAEGVRSLLFVGVNLDQCVSGTMNDAASKGYDIILLSDCAATSSPSHATETIQWNLRNSGFVTTGEEFARGLRG